MDTAYFLKHPRTIADLQKPHILDNERPYEIVAVVKLPAIDYENFITDMLADRQFLMDNAGACAEGDTMRCIFVHSQGSFDGVVVVSEHATPVKWAALIRTT